METKLLKGNQQFAFTHTFGQTQLLGGSLIESEENMQTQHRKAQTLRVKPATFLLSGRSVHHCTRPR